MILCSVVRDTHDFPPGQTRLRTRQGDFTVRIFQFPILRSSLSGVWGVHLWPSAYYPCVAPASCNFVMITSRLRAASLYCTVQLQIVQIPILQSVPTIVVAYDIRTVLCCGVAESETRRHRPKTFCPQRIARAVLSAALGGREILCGSYEGSYLSAGSHAVSYWHFTLRRSLVAHPIAGSP